MRDGGAERRQAVNRRGGWLLIPVMLSLVAMGAFLPPVVSRMQDRDLELQTDVRPLNGIQLALQEDVALGDALSILSAGPTMIAWSQRTYLSQREALAAADEAYVMLALYCCIPEPAARTEEGTASAFLAVSDADAGGSAVVWKCSWDLEDGSTCTIWIDDGTGRAAGAAVGDAPNSSVRVTGRDRQNTLADAGSGAEPGKDAFAATESLAARAEHWAKFCRDYYQAESVGVAPVNEWSGSFELELDGMPGEAQRMYRLPLSLGGDGMTFNL